MLRMSIGTRQGTRMRCSDALDQLVGQDRLKRLIRAELASKKLFRHTLLYGPAGLGKTTIAKTIATLTGSEFIPHTASGAWDALKTERELLALDTSGYLPGGIPGREAKRYLFFVDEIHLVRSFEPWYEPLATLQVVMGSGGYSWIPDTTFVFATTKLAKLPKPFRDRCPLHLRVDPYTENDLSEMIARKYAELDPATRDEIARRSRGVARHALNYAESVARHGLDYFQDAEIDSLGLGPLERQYLDLLRKADRPLSAGTLASLTGESRENLVEIVEPALLALGLIEITTKGRILAGTERGPRLVQPDSGRPSRARNRAIAK